MKTNIIKNKILMLCTLICTALLCIGCTSPSPNDAVRLIYKNADAELMSLCQMYGLSEDDMGIVSVHFGNFIDSENTALVVVEVTNAETAAEMADMGDSLKVFAVMDKDLSRLESSAFSVTADSIDYSILKLPSGDTEFLFINAIDMASGPEEFTGGLYNAAGWENMFPAELYNDPDFLPLLIGNKLYLSTISEADMEQRIFFRLDPASGSLKPYDPQ